MLGAKRDASAETILFFVPLCVQVVLLGTCRPSIFFHDSADMLIKAGADTSGVRKIKDWIQCPHCKAVVHHYHLV